MAGSDRSRAGWALAALFCLTLATPGVAPAGTGVAASPPRGTETTSRSRTPATDYLTEDFGFENDLSYTRLTFTPEASPSRYRLCREAAAAFPVDPTGGTAISLLDDNYLRINLANGRTFPFFGGSASSFFVGSNGYITVGREDTHYEGTVENHFAQPRISALFEDLDPRLGAAAISWRQLDDRVVVTFLDVREHGETQDYDNDFQIELFFDGRIRLTYLELNSHDAIVGLSLGAGLPGGFVESDLSSYPTCPSCSHEVCIQGDPLAPECSSCAATVCAFDSFCCTETWDGVCREEASCLCNANCSCGNSATESLCLDLPAGEPETCDDGDRSAEDGCDADCQLETCGDGRVQGDEQCDDGNNTSGDGCYDDCKLQRGFCEVVFAYEDHAPQTGTVSSLVFQAGWPELAGTFAGEGPAAACTPLVQAAGSLAVEDEPSHLLDLTLEEVSDVFYGPREIWRCLFRLEDPEYSPFPGQITEAIQQIQYGGVVQSSSPVIFTSRMRCGDAPVCGDERVDIGEACDDGNSIPMDGCEPDCTISPYDNFTEEFGSGQNDLAFSSVTFTPDGSDDYYRACRETSVNSFPVEPAFGGILTPDDNVAALVKLTGGRKVSLYGVEASAFYVGNKGTITFGRSQASGPTLLDTHFALPRISALLGGVKFTASSEGEVSWKQLGDRVVVTWLNLTSPTSMQDGDDFQVELFFDGRIRITWLELGEGEGVVGLSDGKGTPPEFHDSDLSVYGGCPDCAHDACGTGVALDPRCSPCAAHVCNDIDDFCCFDSWDSQCVTLADAACGLTCRCGDGAVQEDDGEECDDGNGNSGDGCSRSCRTESCGDGEISPTLGESCDDGNDSAGDGCDGSCSLEAGYCRLTFALSHAKSPVYGAGLLTIGVDFSGALGDFAGSGESIACEPLVAASGAEASRDGDGLAVLRFASIEPPVFGPVELWRCLFHLDNPGVSPDGQDFGVVATEASAPIDPAEDLAVEVSSIACATGPVCGDSYVGAGEECDDGDAIFHDGEYCDAGCDRVPCGKPTNSAGDKPLSKDALFTLRAAVGQKTCDVRVCDADGNNKVLSTDALRILKVAVGQELPLNCPTD